MLDRSKNSAIFYAGGGARGAYQVGATQALFEVLNTKENLFDIFSGFSAGAINACFLAQHANHQKHATKRLANFWRDVTFNDIYRTDTLTLSKNSLKWISDLSFGSIKKSKSAISLLDSSPLIELLEKKYKPALVQRQIDRGDLKALCCQCFNYNRDKSMVLLQGDKKINSWNYPKRASYKTIIRPIHIHASCSIPLVFPSVEIDREIYADGAVRNTAPLSAAIHCGAKKLFIVGVDKTDASPNKVFHPTVGGIISTMIKALFFDALDADVIRLKYLNQSVAGNQSPSFKSIPYFYLKPSADPRDLCKPYFSKFPRVIRYFLEGLGSEDDVAELASFLMFNPEFTKDLMALGREDVLKNKDKILQYFA